MLKVAIIGMGTVSTIHKAAISQLAELVAICDIDSSKQIPGINFYTDIEEMLDKETLDCVHICLPHYLHASAIQKCAAKNVNVFVEKPVVLNYEEAVPLFNIEKELNIKIGVCMQNRYNTTVIKLKELIQDQDKNLFLGSKGIVTWNRTMDYYNEASWRGEMPFAGGGVMINQSIHTLDLLSYLGGEFASVSAKSENFTLPDIDIEDTVMAHFSYKNSQATAMYFATIGYCTNSNIELELVFKDQIFTISNGKLFAHRFGEEPVFICEDQKLSGSKHYYGASHVDAIRNFYKSITDDVNEYVTIEEGAYSLKLIDSIVKSSVQNTKIQI